MQYDTNFKLRLSTIYTKCQHPLLEAAMPVAGSVLGIARMLASKRMMLSSPGLLSLFLSHYASNAIPIFPNAKKEEVYCGIITTHLVISERLAKTASQCGKCNRCNPFRSHDKNHVPADDDEEEW